MNLQQHSMLKNRYRITSSLGRGGFGETYLAIDTDLPSKRICVVKQFKPLRRLDPEHYHIIENKFGKEAQLLEELSAENNQIPKLFAYFVEDGNHYIVQEYIKGKDLKKVVIENGIYDENATIKLLNDLLPVLQYVHSRNIIHRDIKPENIILRELDMKPVLIDFGGVKEIAASIVDENNHPSENSIGIGTQGYAPPEQWVGKPVFSSDVYSMAMTVLYLLTGKSPIRMIDPETKHILWYLLDDKISQRYLNILKKATQPTLRYRYASAREMVYAIRPLKLFNDGRNLARSEDHVAAEKCFTSVIEDDPTWGEAYNRRGVVYNKLYKYELAISDFSKALELNPHQGFVFYNRGVACENLGSYERALKDYESAIELLPDFINSYVNSADLYFSVYRNYSKAIIMYTKAIQLDSNSSSLYSSRGTSYYQLGQYADAITDYSRALAINPKITEVMIARGDANAKAKRYEDAINDYTAALLNQPESALSFLGRGIVYYRINRYRKALKDLSQSSALTPLSPDSFYYKGKVYEKLQNSEKALESYGKAIELDGEYPDAYYARGLLYYKLRKYEESVEDLDAALAFNSENKEMTRIRDKAYFKMVIGKMCRGVRQLFES